MDARSIRTITESLIAVYYPGILVTGIHGNG